MAAGPNGGADRGDERGGNQRGGGERGGGERGGDRSGAGRGGGGRGGDERGGDERGGGTPADARAGRPADTPAPATPEESDQARGATEWSIPGQVGVGPWPGGPPAWPGEDRYDPDLLAHGDTRNVVDAYRYWRRDAVAADLAARAHPFHVAIENFDHDHNIGTVVRTANAFGAAGVHIVGRRRWNRRGAMVTDRYLAVHHHPDVASLAAYARDRGLTVVAVDNTPGAERLETARLPRECLLLFGQEGPGVTDAARAAAGMTVAIAQFGSTRSVNAGVAAGIAMHAWVRQHADLSRAW